MTRAVWEGLLEAVREVHGAAATADFCAFPGDLRETAFEACDHPAAGVFLGDDLGATPYGATVEAIRRASPHAHWRETYKGTAIGDDFMARFGCYCLIGPDAPWTSDEMYGFFVYMPAGLWYPWHEHPAEEMYLVLAGEGLFFKEGAEPRRLGPGEAAFHGGSVPHALLTEEKPVLAYVIWRNGFETAPMLTPGRSLVGPA